MLSMTGYGRGNASGEDLEITVELSSVNRKGLEVGASLPREWQGMERTLCDDVRKAVSRGKVSIALRIESLTEKSGLSWDDAAVKSSIARLSTLAKEVNTDFTPNADALLRLIGLLDTSGKLPDWEEVLPVVKAALSAALSHFVEMRSKEGAALADDMRARLSLLRESTANIRSLSTKTVPHYRELLLERLQKAGLELELEDERVLKEIAIFADRCDIAEELTRLESHFEQFEETLQQKEPVGRKLDFICQELFREINTVGSKANNIDVTRLVIEMKNELERIREQVQNVE
ncbi:YicC/YloC family endoribonuclease [Rubellicoccus peritrichatus]|uniref:YicC/YloC family endoribonuclease n=1 Tax=Rubellicoccus peritrichatus TaxID=3080537 RepID=A0AAQ3LDB7_9BACT|nr:YicC/YloC family endoribonuclease [Puniceicoccus sp. CR14]WOO39949.1 YicC/YloC family endoribonuclease [Puniceicoccus sp. CR14]